MRRECPILGQVAELSATMLPTIEDVFKYYVYVQQKVTSDGHGKHPAASVIMENVASKVESLWLRASIPTVTRMRVIEMIKCHYKKYMALKKSVAARHLQQKIYG